MNVLKAALLAAALVSASGSTSAAVTCSFGTIGGINITNYVEGVASNQAATINVSCTRTANGDPNPVTYTVTFDTGSYNNRALATVSGTNYYITYSKAATTGCTPAVTSVSGVLNWPTSGNSKGTQSGSVNYAGCVAAQTGLAAATYTDSIGLTLSNNAAAGTTSGSAAVSIAVPAQCTFSTPPGAINFNYTALRASPLVATTTFGTTCTRTAPYTLSLDTTTGAVAGLAYSLSLSGSSGTGSGTEQTYTITGTMAAGQPGDCTGSCSGSNNHTVTVSY